MTDLAEFWQNFGRIGYNYGRMIAEFWQNVGRILILSWAFQSLKGGSCFGGWEKRSYGAAQTPPPLWLIWQNLAEFWQNFGRILIEFDFFLSFQIHIEVTLGVERKRAMVQFWQNFGRILAEFWQNVGSILAAFWHYLGITWALFGQHFGFGFERKRAKVSLW